MGLYSGGLIIGRIFVSEIWGGGVFSGGLLWGGGGGLLSEFYGSLQELGLKISVLDMVISSNRKSINSVSAGNVNSRRVAPEEFNLICHIDAVKSVCTVFLFTVDNE